MDWNSQIIKIENVTCKMIFSFYGIYYYKLKSLKHVIINQEYNIR